jgi:Family of unknown function (DUF6567)
MKHKILFAGLLLFSLSLLYGCSTSGMFTSANLTNVQLQQANYKIVAANISGTAEAGYLIGVSFGTGPMTNTMALVRVSGTGMLYKEALENLWKNYEDKYGKVEGDKLALINVRYDTDALNLFLYTSAKVYIRADVIRFE